jgi:redox-sensitive bicupin YhaK (pirin superfamily)
MAVEITPSRAAEVGGLPVRRALPRAGRRTVGAWCFVDHFGPVGEDLADAMQVGPHPHIGLQTVTWLLEGEVLHTDSIGSEQLIRPGQLNLMTAGRGIAHAESARPGGTGSHGLQLWVALPDATRDGAPAFEHHAELPQVQHGSAVATVLVGELAGTRSPARADSPLVGADLALRSGTTSLPVDPAWEHALVVTEGVVEVAGEVVKPGSLAYLPTGHEELSIRTEDPSRVLLVGGEPFSEPVLMWWNFVARTRGEMDAARAEWLGGDHEGGRFATVPTGLPRIPAPGTPWGDPEPEPTIL